MKASVLRVSPLLRRLSPEDAKALAAAATRRKLAAGERLEIGGAPSLALVLEGEIAAWTPADRDGVAEVVGQDGPGAVLGSGELTGVPEYRAATAAEVAVWSAAALRRVFARADGLQRRLAVGLSLRARSGEIVGLLRRTPLFQHVSQALIRWLVQSSALELFVAGSKICREGDEGEEMFLVISGEVAIGGAGAGALARLHRGDFFGEIALVRGTPRVSTATALVDAELLVVDRAAFEFLDARSPAFGHAVRLTAQRRIEVNVGAPREPELVWLRSDDPRVPSATLAGLLAAALAEDEGHVAEPRRLTTSAALHTTVDAARGVSAAYVLCHSDGPVTGSLARELVGRASSIVVVDVDGDGHGAAPVPRGTFHRVHHVVVSTPSGAVGPQPVRRDAIVLRAAPRDLARHRLDRLPDDAQRGLRRIARAVSRRRVGVALGGGAAWGYAHVALIRALEEARIPIDMIAGVSMGAIVGAFYASRGLAGLDRLEAADVEIAVAAIGSVASTRAVSLFVSRHLGQSRLEDLGVPLMALAVDARTAREKVFRHGSIAAAVRASCSLPGVFAPSVLGGHRYLDGAIRHNVPASTCLDAGADFVIACDVVPLPGVPRGKHRRGITGFVLDMTRVTRLSDAVRSLYWLSSDSGQHQASVADAVFSPDLGEFEPWDFPRAKAIVRRAEQELSEWLPATVARYAALSHPDRVDG